MQCACAILSSVAYPALNVFHPEVFDTYIISNTIQSNTTIILYVIY